MGMVGIVSDATTRACHSAESASTPFAGWARVGLRPMEPRIKSFDPHARAREKQSSRAADERALQASPELAARAKAKNEAFASIAVLAKPNLAAARSLS